MIKRLSLTQRLSAVFALLLLACCGASAWLQMAANARYEQWCSACRAGWPDISPAPTN